MNFLKGSLFRRNTEPEELEPMEESGGGILAVWGSPGCGKTVTAVKIAKHLAAQKKNTVLLLCDMTAPMMPCICPPSELEVDKSLGSIFAAQHISVNLIKHNLTTLKRLPHLTMLGLRKKENEYTYAPCTKQQAEELIRGLREIVPYAAAVRYILTNEKYTGDSLWQKTYTSHTLPATRYKNTGEYEQFYAMGTHPPIISKEAFEQAQQLAQKRKSTYGKKLRREPYPLSQKISCGHCGSSYRRKEQVSSAYWCCRKHDTSVKDCPIAPVAEESLYGAFCRLYYKLKHQSIPILEQMLTSLQLIRNRKMLWSPDIVALNKRISDLSSQNQTLAFLKQQGLVDPDIFIAKTNELTKQLRQVKLEKEKLMDAESDMTALQTRDLIDLLEGGPEFLDSFDAELFGELVEKIIIESNDSVRFCLKNGLELRESIERTVR